MSRNDSPPPGVRQEPGSYVPPDEATLQLAIARADLQRINKGEMQMHRAADGWQWVVPSSDNDQIFRFIKTKLLEELLGQKS